jgi:hypothetical protein
MTSFPGVAGDGHAQPPEQRLNLAMSGVALLSALPASQ